MADWHTRAIIYQIDSALFYDLNGGGWRSVMPYSFRSPAYR